MQLQKKFSAWNLLLLSMNGMIGSAWLFAPFYAAKIAGPSALIAWILAGTGTITIALVFAELSALFPLAGGTASIPTLSHGTLAGFLFGWMAWLSALTMAPIEVQAVIQYSANYVPSLTWTDHEVVHLSTQGYCLAFLLMGILCLLNILSFKGLSSANLFLFSFKVGIILLTILTLGLSQHSMTQTLTFSPLNWQAIFSAIASGGVAFAFTGFKHGVELAAEAKHPQSAAPIAIIGSVGICLLIYLGLQWAFLNALPATALNHGFSRLHFSGEIGPFAGLAAIAGFIWLSKLLYADAVISPLGAGLVYTTSTARILFALSKIGCLPQCLQKINPQGFPWVAILINFILGLLIFLPLPGWQAMVSFLVSGMVLSYAIAPITLIALRKKYPDATRPFRLRCAHLIAPFSFYCCNLLVYWTGFDNLKKLSLFIIVSFIFYGFAIFQKKVIFEKKDACVLAWFIPYLIGLNIISEMGNFSGTHQISFGVDLICLGVLSFFIFYLALFLSRTQSKAVSPETASNT